MVTIKKKRFIFTLTETWFGYKFKWSDLLLPSCYLGLRQQISYAGLKTTTETAMLPLNFSMDELYNNFSSSHKRYIKKAQAEGVQCYSNRDRPPFIAFYNEFAKRKGLYTLNTDRPGEFSGQEWVYFYASLNGLQLVGHSYIEDKETGIVRLMESASLRLDDKYDAAQIARANKLLHYVTIKHFKECGCLEYDFGGWDNQQGLLEFKQSFGAAPLKVFNYYSLPYYFNRELKKIAAIIKRK